MPSSRKVEPAGIKLGCDELQWWNDAAKEQIKQSAFIIPDASLLAILPSDADVSSAELGRLTPLLTAVHKLRAAVQSA